MGNYNPIYKNIWTSEKFSKLPPKEKLIYLHLLTNKHTTTLGICLIKIPYIACDCGLTNDEVKSALTLITKIGLIDYFENKNLFYIYKFFKYSKGTIKNPNTLLKTMFREFELLNDKNVKDIFLAENTNDLNELKKQIENKIEKSNEEKTKNEYRELLDKLNSLMVC